MSKPNLLQFGSSVGIYRNKRILDLRHEIGKSIRTKIDFCELAPLLFQVTMAYAAENQIDGNFAGYSTEDWARIFAVNNVPVTAAQAAAIAKAFKTVGLFDGDKIRSWLKFNRHLGDYEGIVKAKRKAARMMHKKREQEARAALHNGPLTDEKTVSNPQKNGPKTNSPNREVWALTKQLEQIDQQLRECSDPQERKELKARKREVRQAITGVDKRSSPPPPSPAPPQKPAKLSPAKWEKLLVENARVLIATGAEAAVTENMVRALLRAGDELPPTLSSRFSLIVRGHKLSEAHNPVPE